jgi:hypothetical protein
MSRINDGTIGQVVDHVLLILDPGMCEKVQKMSRLKAVALKIAHSHRAGHIAPITIQYLKL